MTGIVPASFAAAVGFALIHLYGGRLTFLSHVPRSRWLSFAGGVAVAYVFVHLLPELHRHQGRIEERLEGDGLLAFLEAHVYLLALLGLVVFYGLERLVRSSSSSSSPRRSSSPAAGARGPAGRNVFDIHVVAYGLYNALVGYLLLHREDPGWHGFAFYAVAMGFHFLVNDRGLEADHGHLYRTYGRWLLAAAALAGWAAGVFLDIDRLALSTLFAFLAGGVILNVLKEELPEERESRFSAFAAGAFLYAVLLLAAL